MAGRIHQVQGVGAAVGGLVQKPDRLRLDGDAALALDVHGIEHLAFHFAGVQPAAALDQAVGERRLAVVDMRDDREIANEIGVRHRYRRMPDCRGWQEHRRAVPAAQSIEAGQGNGALYAAPLTHRKGLLNDSSIFLGPGQRRPGSPALGVPATRIINLRSQGSTQSDGLERDQQGRRKSFPER